jgi:hypothetical protein
MAEQDPFPIKQGDTGPSYAVVLTSGDEYVPLDDAEKVKFLMRNSEESGDAAPAVTGEMTFSLEKIPDPKDKSAEPKEIEVWVCVYDWQPGDSDQDPGLYDTEHEVTWESGKIETFPAEKDEPYLQVLVLEDLG